MDAPGSSVGGWRWIPTGRALAVLGGLAIAAAYFMPWFGLQGALFTGAILYDFLGNPATVRQFLPGSLPSETMLLRGLVLLFPLCGAIIAGLALVGIARPRTWNTLSPLLGAIALLTLGALGAGSTRLPDGARWEVGLFLTGLGALVAACGIVLDARPPAPPPPS